MEKTIMFIEHSLPLKYKYKYHFWCGVNKYLTGPSYYPRRERERERERERYIEIETETETETETEVQPHYNRTLYIQKRFHQ